jgi:hypothetical protein
MISGHSGLVIASQRVRPEVAGAMMNSAKQSSSLAQRLDRFAAAVPRNGEVAKPFRTMLFVWRMIFSENRHPLFRIMLFWWRMIFSENRHPLFRIMR